MRGNRLEKEVSLREFESAKINFTKWTPVFQRLGLKPHRFFYNQDAVHICTSEGWFRLSLVKYEKQELKWVRSILEYLEERSFCNWAMPWQKTIIWDENSHCYLIQPWLLTSDCFKAKDPASVARIAEILADFHRLGKDYHENKGIEVLRDRWSTIETRWGIELEKIDRLSGDIVHEKAGKEVGELKKETVRVLSEAIAGWKSSGINALYEHHRRTGVLGHGNLCVENIIWCGNDYYLLNWEYIAFQPKIADLASLINNVGFWEPDWIVFLINEYSKNQSFWSEEYSALMALLRYPAKAVLLLTEVGGEEVQRKAFKEEVKQMAKRERCLTKVWKELGSKNRWVWGRNSYPAKEDVHKISMVLSPMESWGDFSGPVDSLIKIDNDQKLPSDVLERLNLNLQKGVVSGKEGNILEGSAPSGGFAEITERMSPPIVEDIAQEEEARGEVGEEKRGNEEAVTVLNSDTPKTFLLEEEKCPIEEVKPALIKWGGFPKTLVARK